MMDAAGNYRSEFLAVESDPVKRAAWIRAAAHYLGEQATPYAAEIIELLAYACDVPSAAARANALISRLEQQAPGRGVGWVEKKADDDWVKFLGGPG